MLWKRYTIAGEAELFINHVKESNKHYLSEHTVSGEKKAERLGAFTQSARFRPPSLGFIHLFFRRVSSAEGFQALKAQMLPWLIC